MQLREKLVLDLEYSPKLFSQRSQNGKISERFSARFQVEFRVYWSQAEGHKFKGARHIVNKLK